MNTLILIVKTSSNGYLIGAIISFIILLYLIYSLIKPEKF